MAGLSKPIIRETCFPKKDENKKADDIAISSAPVSRKKIFYASKILKTPLMLMIAPMKRIIHETNDNTHESNAKRAYVPTMQINTPKIINL